jgi:hypothetical protein
MDISAQKNEKEKLFDELIDVKLLYKSQVKKWRKHLLSEPGSEKIREELAVLKLRINDIEKTISGYGESFFDVYDAELVKPLSESDILVLRDEIQEVRHSLEAI